MVREAESDKKNTQAVNSRGKSFSVAKRGRPVKSISTRNMDSSIERNAILTENIILEMDSVNQSSIQHTHHLAPMPNSFHQLSGVLNDDEEAEKEASNDEFELVTGQVVHSRKLSVRPVAQASQDSIFEDTMNHSSFVDSRRAKRASGEHLWKHRCFWDTEETEFLKEGVRKYGKGKWKAILTDPAFKFKDRSTVDLKDKWRNLETFVPWSDHEIRRYILLDEAHAPYRTASSNYHIFQNRWPRDAALKVASRDEFYPMGPDSNTPFLIYLREIRSAEPPNTSDFFGDLPDHILSEEEQVVHVYEGTRERRIAADIEKFHNKRFMWVPSVVKLRTEKLSYGRKSTAVTPAMSTIIHSNEEKESPIDHPEMLDMYL